jgi:phosphate transport system permease protein
MKDGNKYLGEIWAEEEVTYEDDSGKIISGREIQIKKGNRDLLGRDFIWLRARDISEMTRPANATTIERFEYGNFYGFLESVHLGDSVIDGTERNLYQSARSAHEIAVQNKHKIEELQDKLTEIITPFTRIQREISLVEIDETIGEVEKEKQLGRLQKQASEIESNISQQYMKIEGDLQKLMEINNNIYLSVQTADERKTRILLSQVVRFYQPNQMNVFQKSVQYSGKLWEFIAENPRESNTEGGVFPAIFGTVLMVLLMSIAVVPFGVLAALYLNEYAKQGTIIRLVRLSVNNLAGVPSIVFGIFGLGFFIYMIGGTVDQLFFSDKLPEPTFGTGGILWASLTLALLTLPVVVVATEEGILAVPRANKEGALALGATRWQMVRKIILPNAMPGILTGLILAISRGAGEVAPLMITGVVKLAPSLAIDGTFPFLHLDRKFMHLGFHIYDVGFQSPNVEAAKPMVYTTALLLILIVIILNIIAIYMRNRLRKKYKTSVF